MAAPVARAIRRLEHGAHGAGAAERRGVNLFAGIAGNAMIASGSLPVMAAMMICLGGSNASAISSIPFAGRRLLLGSAVAQALQLIVPGIGHIEGGRTLLGLGFGVLGAGAGGCGCCCCGCRSCCLHLKGLRIVLIVLVLLAQIGIAGGLLLLLLLLPLPLLLSLTLPLAMLLGWQGYGRLCLRLRLGLGLGLILCGLGGRRCMQRCG